MENKFKEGELVKCEGELYKVKSLIFNVGWKKYYHLMKIDKSSNGEINYFIIDEDCLEKYEKENNKPKTNKNMENKEFTIDDLKSGMIIETRSEEKYLVIKDCEFYGGDKGIAFVNATGFNKSNSYNKDLTCKKMKSYDIMKVYYDDCVNGGTYSMKNQPLIWQRKEKQQFTKAQIAEKLGLSIDEFEIK